MVVDKVRQVRGLKSVFAMLNLSRFVPGRLRYSSYQGYWNPASSSIMGRERQEASLYARQTQRMTCVPRPHSAHEPRGGQGSLSLANRAFLSTYSSTGEQHNPAPIRQVTSATARKEKVICNIVQSGLVLMRKIPEQLATSWSRYEADKTECVSDLPNRY